MGSFRDLEKEVFRIISLDSIEEIKKELLLKVMTEGKLSHKYIENLPIDNELRTFLCELGPLYAYWYAYYVDRKYFMVSGDYPWEETREAACRDPGYAYWYAIEIDGCPNDTTRKAAYKDKDFDWAFYYHSWEISLDNLLMDGYVEN
jgi:hypothetical protein